MPYVVETEGEYEKKYGALSINVKLRRKCCLGQASRSAAESSHQSAPRYSADNCQDSSDKSIFTYDFWSSRPLIIAANLTL